MVSTAELAATSESLGEFGSQGGGESGRELREGMEQSNCHYRESFPLIPMEFHLGKFYFFPPSLTRNNLIFKKLLCSPQVSLKHYLPQQNWSNALARMNYA